MDKIKLIVTLALVLLVGIFAGSRGDEDIPQSSVGWIPGRQVTQCRRQGKKYHEKDHR